jgi:hypothetical protein
MEGFLKIKMEQFLIKLKHQLTKVENTHTSLTKQQFVVTHRQTILQETQKN